MNRLNVTALGLALLFSLPTTGCREEPDPVPADSAKPRVQPSMGGQTPTPGGVTTTGPVDPDAPIPPGHPPIPGLANNAHPPATRPAAAAGTELTFSAPSGWVAQPTRPMTKAIYQVPRAEGDPEDAVLVVSYFPGMKNISLENQLRRWCGEFEQPDATPTRDVMKPKKLEDAHHPTILVDISGTHLSGSMTGAPEKKKGHRMLVAEIRADGLPWFVKLTGPAKTVERWAEDFETFCKEAK